MRGFLLNNPVAAKEFRTRMRGSRAYWLLFAYLALLSLTLFFGYLAWWNSHSAAMESGGAGSAGFTIGRTFFLTLFVAQALLITLITPALTAGAISIEREQQTFEMLRSTTLSPRAIALGKLASSVSFVVLLLTSSLPLVSLCFLLGGVSPGEIFFAYALLVADAFLFGAVGLAWSAHAANTAAATALSYGTIFVWFALTFPFAVPGLSGVAGGNGGGLEFGAVNPIGAVAGAVATEWYYGWTLPGWVPALLIILSLGTLLLLTCINRLEDDPANRAAPQRIATFVFCGILLFFVNGMILSRGGFGVFGGNVSGFGYAPGYASLILLGSVAAVVVALFSPPFLTGDALLGTARRIWQGHLRAGLPFALTLTALTVILLLAGLHYWAGAVPAFRRQPVGLLNPGDIYGFWWRVTALLAAFVFGLGGIGLLLSALLRNRWAALTGLYLLVILSSALPFFSYATLSFRDAAAEAYNPAINTLYLCPWIGIFQIGYASAPPNAVIGGGAFSGGFSPTFTGEFPIVQQMAGYGVAPVWLRSALIYAILGVVGYVLGLRVFRRSAALGAAKTA